MDKEKDHGEDYGDTHIDKYATEWYSFDMEWILRTRSFSRWMRKALLQDDALRAALDEMKQVFAADREGFA